jgi:anti-sigma regulatory factor (Ser/Thr protein kinase)
MQKSTASKIAAAGTAQTSDPSPIHPGLDRTIQGNGAPAPASSGGAEPTWRAFPADLAYGSAIRQTIQGAAIDRMVSPDDTADLVLAVSEAFTNAVRHGSCRAGDCIWMAVEWGAEVATIHLRYLGDRFDTEEPALPPASSQQGRGRYIMSRLLDVIEYRFEEPWTELRMSRRFQYRRGAARV